MKGILLILLFYFLVHIDGKSQTDPLYSQYYLNPILSNPGFTGFGNTLSFDLSIRQQWLGIEGAPRAAMISGHSPLNNSKVSLGGAFQRNQKGPVVENQAVICYSYIIRLADKMLMSMGINGGIIDQRVNFDKFVLGNPNDPNFLNSQQKELFPMIGFGAIIFSPNYYLGFSYPTIALKEKKPDTEINSLYIAKHYYLTGGYNFTQFHKKIVPKATFLCRFYDKGGIVTDITAQVMYKNQFGGGFGYRTNNSINGFIRIQPNKNLGITYSYDTATNFDSNFKQGSHEITLSYDYAKLYRPNKYRKFKTKKVKNEEEEQLKSIRYF